MEGHRVLLAFDTDSEEFARGVEVGRIWTHLQIGTERTFTAHADNAEMLIRIADALSMTCQSEVLDDEWIEVTYEGEPEFADPPNGLVGPHGDGSEE
jgi:hypothetical protein